MALDHASLRKAAQSLPSLIPDWLEVDQFVYWKEEKSIVKILGYIGNIVRIFKNGETFSVELEQLQPLEQFSLNPSNLEAIAHPPFRDIALQYIDDLAQVRIISGTQPDLRPLPQSMHPVLKTAFRQVGITQFYSHQQMAWDELEQGRSIALVTETASGKTNCFLPQAFQLALNSQKTTLLIYPLKALASDQMDKLVTLNESFPKSLRLKIARCTGDVPLLQRKGYFRGTKSPDIILASPDVLHHLLYRTFDGEYELWREFLDRLELVVIDEAHAYLGAFGIHFANVMRRLRLARHYARNTKSLDSFGQSRTSHGLERVQAPCPPSSQQINYGTDRPTQQDCPNESNFHLGAKNEPKWVVSTATIANPLELASQFTGQSETKITLIDRSGARRHERTLLTFKPQSAPNYLVASLVASLSNLGLKGLVFVNSRRTAKSIYSLIHAQTNGITSVDIFHGSLLPAKRRNLLDHLSRGSLSTLISTNCLEAGIDLALLDYVIIRGICSLNSFWQRGGRCGRQAPGLIIFIPDGSNPIDYYYAINSDRFFSQPEKVKLNPNYPSILARHLLCAGAEGGLHSRTVENYFGEKGEAITAELVKQRQLYLSDNGQLSKRGYPHGDISLRGIVQNKIELVNVETGEVLEESSLDLAHRECHKGAIYISAENGLLQRWRCLELDAANSKAELELLKNSDTNGTQGARITKPMVELLVTPVTQLEEAKIRPTFVEDGNLRLSFWWGQVSQKVKGYYEIAQLYAPVCSNRSCLRYHQPQSDDQTYCGTCRKKLSKKLTDKVIEEICFTEPLTTSYDSPILRIEINHKLASAIYTEAETWQKTLMQKYGKEENIPSSLLTVFDCNSVHLALHSASHSLIKAIPLLFLANSNDVSSLIDERDVRGDSNANRFVCYLFDTVHEGCGTTEAIYEDWESAIQKAISLLTNCDCGDVGCPKCLSDQQCPEGNEALFKPLGVWLLRQCTVQNADAFSRGDR
ncbi:DEAD/DEAH box helicase [Aphanothece hegewaldii CCALA 016]|uniref:DEAD/DEAH box helicase n=1 Tax=Aphanothece hegewaldii CCALA 016 TaxID=2107694 RepID=A0A2T1LQV0_9CHRO|nr:DEAD/DEAH box helicase [Aphanothece hegewaldii]PSF30020.1 DEAD/DEAH box helicase [Aphanothece hegewaldii CCALA 016]